MKYSRMHCLSVVPPQGRTSYIDPAHSVQAEKKQIRYTLVIDDYLPTFFL